MSRGEDPHSVVIDQEALDLQPTIQSHGREDVILNLEPRHLGEKNPRLEGNIAGNNKDGQQGNYSKREKNPRLEGNIAGNNKDHRQQQGNYRETGKTPRLKGNIADDNKDYRQQQGNFRGTETTPRLKGNIADDKTEDDIVEIDNLMMKWEEILKAGYNFDKGNNVLFQKGLF